MENSRLDEKYFKFLFDNVDFSLAEHEFVFDKEGNPVDYRFLYANKAYCNSIGKTFDEIVGKTVSEVFNNIEQYWIDEYYKVIKTGEPHHITRYAQEFERYFSVQVIKTGDINFAVSFRDVTDILEGTQLEPVELPESGRIKGDSQTGFFEININTYQADVSEMFCEIIGVDEIKQGEFRKTFIKKTHPNDFEKVTDLIKKVMQGEVREVEVEFRIFNEQLNKYIWVNFFVYVIEIDDAKKPVRYTGLIKNIDRIKKTYEELFEIEDLFKEARKLANLTTFLFDPNELEFTHSSELDEFTGVDRLVSYDQFREIVHPDDIDLYNEASEDTLSKEGAKITTYRIIKNNETRIIQSYVYGKNDIDGKSTKVFGILRDITESERQRIQVDATRRSFELIFNSSPAAICLINSEFEIAFENETFREMFHVERNELGLSDLLGDSFSEIAKELKKETEVNHYELKYMVDGEKKTFDVNIVKIAEDFVNEYQATILDITEQAEYKDRILYLATHDVLTGIFNRNYFEEVVEEKKHEYPLGLLLCDIDGLKLINDAFGHIKGDELLQSLAKTLSELDESYICSRIGGDEFAVLIDGADEDLLNKIENRVKKSMKDIGHYGIDFDVSLGYSILDEENNNFNKVFNRAENMMYRRKLTDRSSRKSNALTTIMQTLHEKTEETKNHCKRVGDYSSMLLSEIGYKRNVDLDDIRFLSDVHDIGKIATKESILTKKTKLTPEEYEEIKYHSEAGYKIIKNIIDKEDIAYGILHHHERYDGKGYPHGLIGDEIPLFARILSIADSYDTMIRGRVYQKPISKEDALKDIIKNKGKQFDPELATTFVRLMESIED